ncbi:hypothetical protein EV426DRAFT_707541 [Tirmania nivea]|nr:hypothetical protein EV426DRAFT_707541 [Tirmania nivea]
MTAIRNNSAPSTVTTDKPGSTLRYQSAPTVLGLPEGSSIRDENGKETVTGNIVVGHYFNNPLVTGYVRKKHAPRRLLEGYEKLINRQNYRRSKAMRRLKEEGTWTVGPVSDDGLQDLRSEASAFTRPLSAAINITEASQPLRQASLGPASQPAISGIELTSSVNPTNIISPVISVGEVDISDSKYCGIIGYNFGQTVQEVQKMFPPRIQQLIEEIVEGHTDARYANRKYWYIYFKSEIALQHVLVNAPRSWMARDGRKENDPKITVMKDCHSPPGSDSDLSGEDSVLTGRMGQTSRAKQLMCQRSISMQKESDRSTQSPSIVPSANIASFEQPASNPGAQLALLSHVNPILNNQEAQVSDAISSSFVRSSAKSLEQLLSSYYNDSPHENKPMPPASCMTAAQPVSSPQTPARPSLVPTISSAPQLRIMRTAAAEATSIFSDDNPIVNSTPPMNIWGSRAQDRPGRGESHAHTTSSTPIAAIIPIASSTPTKNAQFQAAPPRPDSIPINAPPGSLSRLGEVMARAWPQPNFNIAKERPEAPKSVSQAKEKEASQSRERTRPGTPIAVFTTGKSNALVTGPRAARTVTPIDSTVVKVVNPELLILEPITPEPVRPMTNTPTLPQSVIAITKATPESKIPTIPTTIPEVPVIAPVIVRIAADPPDLVNLDEDSLPISTHGEGTFELPPPAGSLSGSVSTIGDWRTDLAGLEWVVEEVEKRGISGDEKNRIQDSEVEAVARIMEGCRMGAGGKRNVDSEVESTVRGSAFQSNRPDTVEDWWTTAGVANPLPTDEVKREINDGTRETMNLLLVDGVVINQESDTENIDLSMMPIYGHETAGIPGAALKTEVAETPVPANPDNDEEWEDEDKAKEAVKERIRGHRGQNRSSKRKDLGKDLVSAHLAFLRRAGMETGLREILGELRKSEKK